MARYIELDMAIHLACEFVGKLTHNQVDAVEMATVLEDAPTADVVPRSEVEKAKQDVAREILSILASHTEFGIECQEKLIDECKNEKDEKFLKGQLVELYSLDELIKNIRKKFLGE